MKRITPVFLILLALAWSSAFGQTTLPSVPGNPALKEPPSGISGSHPQNIDWFNWEAGQWQPDKKVTLTYTGWGDPLIEIWEYEDDVTPDLKITYSYNNDQLQTGALEQEKVDGAWVDRTRYTTEYNARGYVTLEKQETNVDGSWLILYATTSEYEFQGDVLHQVTSYDYDLNEMTFKPESRTTYTYYQNGLVSEAFTEVNVDGVWYNGTKAFYFWETSTRLDYMLVDSWVDTDWMHFWKYDFNYLDEESYDFIMFLYNFVTSEYDNPYLKGSYRFDTHHNLVLYTQEMQSSGNWILYFGHQYDITYEGNLAVQRIAKTWAVGASSWENATKEVFKNFINLGMEDPVSLSLRLDCYPNPAGDRVTVDFSAFGSQAWRIELIDLSGKPVRTVNPELPAGRITWDIGGLPPGLFLIRMSDQQGRTLTRNLIRIR
ncbi:MAG: T9SS type A sorting domain-containing protein [Bacteroidales bacterium]